MEIVKLRPLAEIETKYNEDGWQSWDEIVYRCPKCRRKLRGWNSEVGCVNCGIFYGWGKREPKIVITKTIEW